MATIAIGLRKLYRNSTETSILGSVDFVFDPLFGSREWGRECACPAGSTCGSDFDEFGHPRFFARGRPGPGADPTYTDRRASVYYEDLDWGFNQFPNFFEACISIFQCITLEGWAAVMYRVMDAYDPALAVAYFVVLILFGAFCVVNLVLSVLWDSFVVK